MAAPCGHRPAPTGEIPVRITAGLKVKFPCLQCRYNASPRPGPVASWWRDSRTGTSASPWRDSRHGNLSPCMVLFPHGNRSNSRESAYLGERQVSSSVMELSLQQNNINEALAFNNLTEDFVITIPGSSKNKMATKNITFYSRGNKTAVYHFYNLTDMAEGFMVTIIPLNTSVVYGVSGRYDDRPDDQNYSVSMETYVLPEQCALMKTLSGDEDDVDKTQATMFIKGQRDPAQYYVKVRILGPATECGDEEETDLWDSEEGGFFAYEIQWARLRCVYWNETQETWLTDGCAISNKSTINSTICHCNHLTAFGSDVVTPPSKADFGELKFSDVGDNGAVVTAVCVEFWIFVLTMVAIKEMARWKKKLNELSDPQHGDPAHLYIRAGIAEKKSSIAFKPFGDATTT